MSDEIICHRPRIKGESDMKGTYKAALAVLAGVVIGATGIKGLYAQGNTPPAYVVFASHVTDQDTFQKFLAGIPSTLRPFNGRYIVRGGKIIPHQGEPPERITVIAFDSMATAQRWYNSPAFTELNSIPAPSA